MAISLGNTKLGLIPNLPLPPITSCHNCSQCSKSCYAIKSYRQYPDTKRSWDYNLRLWKYNPLQFERKIIKFLSKKHYANFRWHTSGEIQGQRYLDMMVRVANLFKQTNFLCFTKWYDLDFSKVPENLNIIFSVWPGMELPTERHSHIKWTWMEHDPRTPEGIQKCSGHCDGCLYCFDSSKKSDLVMHIH
jgi:hypothetical protein